MTEALRVYFVGIGGIGMSALAQFFQYQGKIVSGSDREGTPTTKLLAERDMQVWIGEDGCHIPADTELLVYSDAVPVNNAERVRAREMKIPQTSYFEALGEVSKAMRTIAVAGTHGKTTTTAMLAKILQDCEKEPTAIVGSIVQDFGSNFLPGRNDLLVVEACEYREHLLELSPEILVITNVELDHTDFFPSLSALQSTFSAAVERVPKHGVIVANPSDPVVAAVLGGAHAPIIDYTSATVPELQLLGEFNAMNARAAKTAARSRTCKNPTPIRRFSISRVRGGASSIRAKRRRALSFLMITRTIRLPLKKHWMPRVRNFPIKRYLSRSIHTSTLARATSWKLLLTRSQKRMKSFSRPSTPRARSRSKASRAKSSPKKSMLSALPRLLSNLSPKSATLF